MDLFDDHKIIRSVLRGNVDTFGLIVKRYEKPMYDLMFRVTKSYDSAEDLTQEAFIRAFEKLELFTPGKKFFPWLYTIGLNVAKDFLRKKKRNPSEPGEKELSEAVGEISSEHQDRMLALLDSDKVGKAMEKLSFKYREALILYYREEFSMQDVAGAMEISLSGAKTRVHRGLKHLRTILGV